VRLAKFLVCLGIFALAGVSWGSGFSLAVNEFDVSLSEAPVRVDLGRRAPDSATDFDPCRAILLRFEKAVFRVGEVSEKLYFVPASAHSSRALYSESFFLGLVTALGSLERVVKNSCQVSVDLSGEVDAVSYVLDHFLQTVSLELGEQSQGSQDNGGTHPDLSDWMDSGYKHHVKDRWLRSRLQATWSDFKELKDQWDELSGRLVIKPRLTHGFGRSRHNLDKLALE
jgi:hypothetical protein